MRRLRWIGTTGLLALCGSIASAGSGAAPTNDLLARIKAVGGEGAGNAEASKAWKELVRLGPGALPAILAAMEDRDAATANWLRAAVDAIAEKELNANRPLPAEKLEKFALDTKQAGVARRLAYEWLTRVDKTAPTRLLPGMLQDRSVELRRDAVAAVVKDAKDLFDKDDKTGATTAYRKALTGACDKDQVDAIAKQLKTLGVEVDLPVHFGFVTQWHLLASFDNKEGGGFKVAYPPEKGVDLSGTLKGKDGAEVRWVAQATSDAYGIVNLNKVIGKQKGAIAYAHAVIDSPAERQVEIRAGSFNALKMFQNGKQVFAREEYHHGMAMDQHVAAVTLKAGRNELLLKVCQNEQTETWAQEWIFQVRLCDAVGVAVPFKQEKVPVKTKEATEVKP